MKEIVFLVVLLVMPTLVGAGHQWRNACPDPEILYCENVGKDAYNKFALRNIKLGKIIGVTWRPKGSLIGYSPAIPLVGIPADIRTSPRDAYYYIIDDGGGEPFIRQCREIDAK